MWNCEFLTLIELVLVFENFLTPAASKPGAFSNFNLLLLRYMDLTHVVPIIASSELRAH
jgi:hypothetical protein